MKFLSYEEARQFYNRFGARQDRQSFYEQPAIDELCAHANLTNASDLAELGCGTGKLAVRLLAREMSADARYLGIDVSKTMVGLARERTRCFGQRAVIQRSDGNLQIAVDHCSFDRFVACYVLDLLSPTDIFAAINEAARILRPKGLLCRAGLTNGNTPVTRLVSKTWKRVQAKRPMLVGGCRPLEVSELLQDDRWQIKHRRGVSARGVPSEVLIVERNVRG